MDTGLDISLAGPFVIAIICCVGLWLLGRFLMFVRDSYTGKREIYHPPWVGSENTDHGYDSGGGYTETVDDAGCVASSAGFLGWICYIVAGVGGVVSVLGLAVVLAPLIMSAGVCLAVIGVLILVVGLIIGFFMHVFCGPV
mgnify:CR=1 FL=1